MSISSSRLRSSALAGLTAAVTLCGALSPALLPVSAAASARAPAFGALATTALTTAALGADGSVLGLEGDDEAATGALTTALRRQFAARGLGGAKEMSSLELRLTMGCDDPPAPECMAEGGKTLGIQKMVYGKLKRVGDGYTLDLALLDTASATVVERLSEPLSADALSAGVIDGTASDLVDRILGLEPEPTPAVEPTAPPPVIDQDPVADDTDDGGGLVWGRHRAATWKKAGLATSGVLMLASLGTAVATTLMIRQGGPVYNDLIAAAEASLTDDRQANDINPYTDQDLCNIARTAPPGEMGTVTNASVADVCQRGDTLATVATATWIGTGVFAASTIAFTTLLFVRRDRGEVASRLQRRGVSMGLAPMGRGGAMLSGGLRF